MERQVRAATLDNFGAPRFMAVVKKKKKESRVGDKEERERGGLPAKFFFLRK